MSGVYPTPYWQLPPYTSQPQSPYGAVPFQMVNLTYVPPINSQINANTSKWAPLKMSERSLKPLFGQSTPTIASVVNDKKSAKTSRTQEPAYKIIETITKIQEKFVEKPAPLIKIAVKPAKSDNELAKVDEKLADAGKKSVEIIESDKSKPIPILTSCQPAKKIIRLSSKERFLRIYEKNMPFVNQLKPGAGIPRTEEGHFCNLCEVSFGHSSRNLNEHVKGHRHRQAIKNYEKFVKSKELSEKNAKDEKNDDVVEKPAETKIISDGSKNSNDFTKIQTKNVESMAKPSSCKADINKKFAISKEPSSCPVSKTESKSVSHSPKTENSSKSIEKRPAEVSKRPSTDSHSAKTDSLPKKLSKTAAKIQTDSQDSDSATQRYFGCEICSIHGMPYSTQAVQLHLDSKAHKYMKIFWDKGLWPGPSEKISKFKLKEPQIYKFLDRKGTLECKLCNEAIVDGHELMRHQQGSEHLVKLTQQDLQDKLPVIYLCEVCDEVFCGRQVYYRHNASATHLDKIERQALEDCYFFYTTGCSKGNSCTYRHCALALKSKEICQMWSSKGHCPRLGCPFRHSAVIVETVSVEPGSIPPLGGLNFGCVGRSTGETTKTEVEDFKPVDEKCEPTAPPKIPTEKLAADERERKKQEKLQEIIKLKTSPVNTTADEKFDSAEKIPTNSIVDLVKNLKKESSVPKKIDQPKKKPADWQSSDIQGSIVNFVKNLKSTSIDLSGGPKTSDAERCPEQIETVKNLNVFELLKGLKSSPSATTHAYHPLPTLAYHPVTPAYQQPSLEAVANLLVASKSDENLDVVLEILLQNEMVRSHSDPIRIMLIQNLIKMRNERKESQKRLNQVFSLLNPETTAPNADALHPADQSDLKTILALIISSMGSVPPPVATAVVDHPPANHPGYVNRAVIDPSTEHPLKMATKFAAVCGMKKDELERKLAKFQSFDHRNGGQFVYAGKDYLENLDLLTIGGGSSSDEPTTAPNAHGGLMEAISSDEDGNDGLTPISSDDDNEQIRAKSRSSYSSNSSSIYNRKRHRSDSRSSENRRKERRRRSDSQANEVHNQCSSSIDVDPNILLYYGNSEESELDTDLIVSNEKYVENFVVQVDNVEHKKIPVFDRLGYFSKRGKQHLKEKREKITIGKTTLFRTVRNDLCHH